MAQFGGRERAALTALATVLFGLLDKAQRSLLPRAVALAIGTLASYLTGKVKNKLEIENWKRKIYLNRLQVVLMSVDVQGMLEAGVVPDARVEKRTLFEGGLLDSIMNGNSAAAALVSQAASKCSATLPFVTQHLDFAERYQVLNNALNLVSSFGREGHLSEELQPGSTVGGWFVFALVADDCVRGGAGGSGSGGGDSRLAGSSSGGGIGLAGARGEGSGASKVRIILFREEALLALSQCSEEFLSRQDEAFRARGSVRHQCRWLFLRRMVDMYHKQRLFHDPAQAYPEQERLRPMHVLRLFLAVPCPGGGGGGPAAGGAPLASSPRVATPDLRALARSVSATATMSSPPPPLGLGRVPPTTLLPRDSPNITTPVQDAGARRKRFNPRAANPTLQMLAEKSPAMYSPRFPDRPRRSRSNSSDSPVHVAKNLSADGGTT